MKELNEQQRKWVADCLQVICGRKPAPELALAGAVTAKAGWSAAPDDLRFDSGFGEQDDTAKEVQSIAIYPDFLTLVAGGTAQFSATITYTDGEDRLALPGEVDWHTSERNVVSFGNDGLATAQSVKGTSKITATAGGKTSNTATVDVVVLESIMLDPRQWQMRGGEKKQFNVLGVYSDAIRRPLTTGVAWSVSNEKALRINTSTGLVTAEYVTDMSAVRASYSNGRYSDSAGVHVSTAVPKSLTIAPRSVSVIVGKTTQITATSKDSHGYAQDESEAVLWECTPPNLVSFDGKGGLSGLVEGSGKITAKDRNNPSIVGTADIRVAPNIVKVTSIVITPENATIPLYGSKQYRARGYFDDGTDRSLDSEVVWSTDGSDTVRFEKNTAHGKKSGDVAIIATFTSRQSGTIITATQKTRATVPTLRAIEIEPANGSMIVGGQLQLRAVEVYSDGSRFGVSDVEWDFDRKLLYVDRNGNATAKAAGDATIKVSNKRLGKSASTMLKITPQVLESIKIVTDYPASFDGTMIRGQRMQFRAFGVYPVGGGNVETRLLKPVDWGSDDDKIISIDKDGLATALVTDTTSIYADNRDGKQTAIEIRVTESNASSVSATDMSKFPEKVVKPYETARAKYQDLLVQVRELDGVPKLVQALDSIYAEISKSAKRQTVNEANAAKGQQFLLESIKAQINAFNAYNENAKTHIAASESDLEIFKGELEVKELRKKSDAQKKKIEHALDAIKIGNNLARDPVEAVVDFVKILVDLFEVDTYTQQADALEKKLKDAKFKSLRDKIAAVKKDLQNAKAALNEAGRLAKEVTAHIEKLRRKAEDHFDIEADQAEKKGGKKISFRFSQLNKPLDMANKIVSKLVPDVRSSAEISAVAISKYIDERNAANEPKIDALKAMVTDAYAWRVQSTNVGKQAQTQRQELEKKRKLTDEALVNANPDITADDAK